MLIGNSSGVDVSFNGVDVEVGGSPGKVRKLRLPLADGSIPRKMKPKMQIDKPVPEEEAAPDKQGLGAEEAPNEEPNEEAVEKPEKKKRKPFVF